MLYPLLVSSIAGVSTAIGAVIIICSKNITDNQMGFSQGFAAGVMLAVSILDILPESFKNYFVYMNGFNAARSVAVLFAAGIVMGWAVCGVALPGTAVEQSDKTASAKRMALVTTAVMVFHNMPEGVLTFFSAAKDLTVGAKMALAVALHNIPEGMAIAAPVLYISGSKTKAFMRSFAAGMAEPFAGLVAYILLHSFITPAFLNGVMPMVAGVMCQAAVCELIPNSARISNFQHTLCGIITGIIVMSIGLFMF